MKRPLRQTNAVNFLVKMACAGLSQRRHLLLPGKCSSHYQRSEEVVAKNWLVEAQQALYCSVDELQVLGHLDSGDDVLRNQGCH